MINKILVFFILPCMILAMFLSIVGVQQIAFGNDYYNFLQSVNNTFNGWKLEIPDIPRINTIPVSSYDSNGIILQVLIKIANFFVGFVNTIVLILNVIISVINVIIQILQFILSLIYCCKDFINKLAPQS